MDEKSDTLKVHMELKNKSTTMNKSSREGTISRLKKFENENPGYKSIIGNVHDSTNRETSQIHENRIAIYYYGGNSLFKGVFGEHSDEVKNFVTETVISFYEEKDSKSNLD